MDIIIETPKGSNLKFAYDEHQHMLHLRKVLPAGLVFPFDFGFIPQTKGGDGDPLDVMVVSEFGTFPGCVIKCRIVGCLNAEQTKGDKVVRNDRYIAIPELSLQYAYIDTITEIPPVLIIQIKDFFTTYLQAEGASITWLLTLSAAAAMEQIQKS